MSACYIQVSTFCHNFETTFPFKISQKIKICMWHFKLHFHNSQCYDTVATVFKTKSKQNISGWYQTMVLGNCFSFRKLYLLEFFKLFLRFYLWELLWGEAHLTSVKGLPPGPPRGVAPVPYWGTEQCIIESTTRIKLVHIIIIIFVPSSSVWSFFFSWSIFFLSLSSIFFRETSFTDLSCFFQDIIIQRQSFINTECFPIYLLKPILESCSLWISTCTKS